MYIESSHHAWINGAWGDNPHEKLWRPRLGTRCSLLLGAQTSKPFSWCSPPHLLGNLGEVQLRSYNQRQQQSYFALRSSCSGSWWSPICLSFPPGWDPCNPEGKLPGCKHKLKKVLYIYIYIYASMHPSMGGRRGEYMCSRWIHAQPHFRQAHCWVQNMCNVLWKTVHCRIQTSLQCMLKLMYHDELYIRLYTDVQVYRSNAHSGTREWSHSKVLKAILYKTSVFEFVWCSKV